MPSVDGKVSPGLYNAIGKFVIPLFVNNTTTTAGTYTINVNISSVKTGTFILRLSLKTGTVTTTYYIQLVKQ